MDKVLIAFVGFTLVAFGTAQDCISTILQDVQKCYNDQNFDVTISSDTDTQNALPTDISKYCRRQEEWKTAVACALNKAKSCYQQLSLSTAIFPNVDKYTQGITFLCCNVTDLNPSCITNQYSGYYACVLSGATAVAQGISPSSNGNKYIEAIVCSATQIAYDCMKQNIGTCGTKAKKKLLEYYNEYARSAVCGNLDPEGDDYTRTGISPECNSGAIPTVGLAFLLAVIMVPLLGLLATF